MAYIDLGNPTGEFIIAGPGAAALSRDIGGVALEGPDAARAYQEWYDDTASRQVAPECGARALRAAGGVKPEGGDDFGTLEARHAGSGSI